jgi:hypothetical protein
MAIGRRAMSDKQAAFCKTNTDKKNIDVQKAAARPGNRFDPQ